MIIGLSFALYGALKKGIKAESEVSICMETLSVLPLALGFIVYAQLSGLAAYSSLSGAELALLALSGVVTSVPLMLLTDGMPDLTPLFTTPRILLSWLFLGVFGNAVCFAIWNIAFKRLGVVITNNYLYASPFVTLVVGYIMLDEKITLMSVIGAVLITAGVIVALKKPKETV